MYQRLREIPGIGEKIAERILDHFSTEEEALRVIENFELEKLLNLNLPYKKLVELVRYSYSKKFGFEYVNLCKTREAREIYSRIIELTKKFAVTDYAKLKMHIFYPTKDIKELKRRFEIIENAKKVVKSIKKEEIEEIKKLLKKVSPLKKAKQKRIVDEILVTDSVEVYQKLDRDLIETLLLESPEDLEYLKDYKLIRFINMENKIDLSRFFPNVVEVDEKEALPERTLEFFIANLETITASCEIVEKIEGKKDEIEKLKSFMKKLQKKESKKIEKALENLYPTVEKCLEEANREIEEEVEKSKISIAGKEILEIISNREVPERVAILIDEILRKWEDKCAEILELDKEISFRGIFKEKYPAKIEVEKLAEIERFLEYEYKKREFLQKVELLREMEGYIELSRDIVKRALEIDFTIAIGEFSSKYNTAIPEISEKLGIGFIDAKSMKLVVRKEEVQPVSYVVGESLQLGGCKGERVVVITGANSGGKTTLLETIAEIQIASQCGLPVIAKKARVTLLDGIYYFKKATGVLEAGAFETFLKSLASVANGKERKLVLADEIEATTEPGAAAKIINALLKWFYNQKNTMMVLVTHLGEEISFDKVRIDGIEAKGLDENLNLIVNRNPVLNKIAKSTPELILERLSKTEKNKEFYQNLLKEFHHILQ